MEETSHPEQPVQVCSPRSTTTPLSRRSFVGRSATVVGAIGGLSLLSMSGLLAGCDFHHRTEDHTLTDLYTKADTLAAELDSSQQHDAALFVHAHADALHREIQRKTGTTIPRPNHNDAAHGHNTDNDTGARNDRNHGGPRRGVGIPDKLKEFRSSILSAATDADPQRNNGVLLSIAASLSVITSQTSSGGSESPKSTPSVSPRIASDAATAETDDSSHSSDKHDRPRKADVTAMNRLLATEYEIIYGLGLALPHVETKLASAIESATNKHRSTRDRIISWLKNSAHVSPNAIPLANAGYSFSQIPKDSTSAQDFVIRLERYACAHGYDSGRRVAHSAAIAILSSMMTSSAVDAAYFISTTGGHPMNDSSFHLPGMGT